MVYIVGAGPGAPDLITVRGQRLLSEADVVIYAGSLVNPALLKVVGENAQLYDSARMTLEEVEAVYVSACAQGKMVVRLHTGDPSLYGAIREQMDFLEKEGIPFEVCPGVSAFCGAAASLKLEYTLPGVSQSLVITRMAGRTAVPEAESIRSFAAHRASMVLFLSTGLLKGLSAELIEGGYAPDTPAALVYKATWPEERIIRCTVSELYIRAREAGITKTALILVGAALSGEGYSRSKLYDQSFTTGFRQGTGVEMGERKEGEAREGGMLSVVGIGPGFPEGMTAQAFGALRESEVIAGYTVYTELVEDIFPDKTYIRTPMTKEEERCRLALSAAAGGKRTALICSGDAGIYGLAGLILTLAAEYPGVRVRVIAGVTAACSGAALLGAPLTHDFAVISLSDRLTLPETIFSRVEAAAATDFVLCIYNPASKARPHYMKAVCEIVLKYRPAGTVCGVAARIGREGEAVTVTTLGELAGMALDMFSTVFIGNKSTRNVDGRMVTPRGYPVERRRPDA